jgi:hypothetical protein
MAGPNGLERLYKGKDKHFQRQARAATATTKGRRWGRQGDGRVRFPAVVRAGSLTTPPPEPRAGGPRPGVGRGGQRLKV